MSDRIIFINHATVLIELNGTRILTDPVFSFSISFFLPRLKSPGISLENLPPIDLILVSHNHYDHLNLRSLRRLAKSHQARVIMTRGNGSYPRRAGFDSIDELDWGDSVTHGGLTITCVPAKHFSGRTLWDRNKSVYGGFVIESKEKAVYFAGDTAYGSFLKELGTRFSLDVALLPIGAYKPYEWFKNIHLNPKTAVQAFLDCGAKSLVPVHWGTFKISDEPMGEPPKLLEEEAMKGGVADRVHILENGEAFNF